MGKKSNLELQTRRDIYNYVLRFPGSHLTDISKKLLLRKNNVDYHLKILEKNGLVEKCSDETYDRYFPTKLEGKKAEKVITLLDRHLPYENQERLRLLYDTYIPGRKEKEIINLMKRPALNKIIAVLFFDDYSLTQISKILNKHWTTVSYHLKKIKRTGIIEEVIINNEKKYRLKDKDLIIKIQFMYFAWKKQINKDGKTEYTINYGFIDYAMDFYFDIMPIPFCAGFNFYK